MLDRYHSHFILITDNDEEDPSEEVYRLNLVQAVKKLIKCYVVTIIVEGGLGVLRTTTDELNDKRPVVIIQGSGRMSNIISNLFEKSRNQPDSE